MPPPLCHSAALCTDRLWPIESTVLIPLPSLAPTGHLRQAALPLSVGFITGHQMRTTRTDVKQRTPESYDRKTFWEYYSCGKGQLFGGGCRQRNGNVSVQQLQSMHCQWGDIGSVCSAVVARRDSAPRAAAVTDGKAQCSELIKLRQ